MKTKEELLEVVSNYIHGLATTYWQSTLQETILKVEN